MATNPQDLINYLATAGGLAGPASQQAQNNLVNRQLGEQQIQQNAGILAQQQAQAQRQQAFQTRVADYTKNPTPQGLASLATEFPEQAKALQQAADLKDAPQKQADLTYFGGLYSAADRGRTDLVLKQLQQRKTAEQAAGIATDDIDDAITQIQSGDTDALNSVKAFSLAQINAHDPEAFAKAYGGDQKHFASTGDGAIYDQITGKVVREGAPKESNAIQVPIYDAEGHRVGTQLVANGGKGGDLASSGSGGAAGSGDVSRLINTDAGGGYVPDSVKTLGQFVGFGRGLNARGAKSSSAGTYQINGTTMAEFAPKALGSGWRSAPFNADTQDKVGEAIFDWAKQQPNPAAALRGRWVSLDGATAQKLVQGSWNQAKGTIAQGETGGGAGASAGTAGGVVPKNGYFGPQGGTQAQDASNLTGDAFISTLPTGRQALLKAINEGRAPAPKPGTRFGQQLSEELAQAYPDQDATTFAAKQQTRKDFTGSGKAAVALASYNRFAAHLNSAWAIHQRLGGPNLGPLSGIAASAAQSFSPKDVNAYNTEIEGIQGEFQKLTKLGVANEGEANRLIHAARAAQSAEGRAGALEAMASLVAGAYQPQVAQWKSAFPGKPLPVDVTPASKAVINNVIHGGKSALPMGSNGAPVGNARGFGQGQSAAPVRVTTPAQAMALPPGTVFITPDGRRKVR